ncbi:hypothetical protein LJC37_03270 [Bacteroidales bacterium OttesenSCG-928-E04]|nr:hypothetical protein [Bacteroidales bacterium OttesenSCG-928-E04]
MDKNNSNMNNEKRMNTGNNHARQTMNTPRGEPSPANLPRRTHTHTHGKPSP